MTRDTIEPNLRSSWATLKIIGAVVLFAIAVGSVVVTVAVYVGSGPTREEFERERDLRRDDNQRLKDDVTTVKMEQIKIRGEVEKVTDSQQRIEKKMDDVIEAAGRRR